MIGNWWCLDFKIDFSAFSCCWLSCLMNVMQSNQIYSIYFSIKSPIRLYIFQKSRINLLGFRNKISEFRRVFFHPKIIDIDFWLYRKIKYSREHGCEFYFWLILNSKQWFYVVLRNFFNVVIWIDGILLCASIHSHIHLNIPLYLFKLKNFYNLLSNLHETFKSSHPISVSF